MNSWSGIDEFLAVAQARSFIQAARRLGVSNAHVSREITRLEERLGQRLFYRTTRRVSLTNPGERLFERCRRLRDERDEALADISEDADDLQGQLRMTCAVAYGRRFICPIVTRFMKRHPRLSVDLNLDDAVLDIVNKGVDLAVRFGHLEDSRLMARRIASRTWRLCAAPDYLDKAGAPASVEDLRNHSCILGPSDRWSFVRDGQPIQHRPHGRLRCNNADAVLMAALEGFGFCYLPDFYIHDHLERGTLVEIFSEYRTADEGVWAVCPNRRYLPQMVRSMIEDLQASLR